VTNSYIPTKEMVCSTFVGNVWQKHLGVSFIETPDPGDIGRRCRTVSPFANDSD